MESVPYEVVNRKNASNVYLVRPVDGSGATKQVNRVDLLDVDELDGDVESEITSSTDSEEFMLVTRDFNDATLKNLVMKKKLRKKHSL